MNDTRKISVLHIFSGDLWAGAEVVIFNLLSELKKNKQIQIYALSMNQGILTKKLAKIGIKVDIIDEARYPFFCILIKAILLFYSKKIDIIHTHRYKENILGFLLKIFSKPKAKLVTTVHGDIEKFSRKDKIKIKLNEIILKKSFYTVAVSKELKNRLINRGFKENNILCIYNGIKIRKERCEKEEKNDLTIHIGSVGRLVPVKRYDLFVDIAYKIKKITNKDLCFSILGDGPMKEIIISKIKKYNLSDCFKIFSPVTDPGFYYKSLDIYLNTSKHEGLPLSILEAMNYCLPVVAFKVGGIPEIIDHGINGFIARDFNDYINILISLIKDPKLRKIIGKKAKEKIEKYFDSEIMAKNYEKLYRAIIK